jgi:hypothetical protein
MIPDPALLVYLSPLTSHMDPGCQLRAGSWYLPTFQDPQWSPCTGSREAVLQKGWRGYGFPLTLKSIFGHLIFSVLVLEIRPRATVC